MFIYLYLSYVVGIDFSRGIVLTCDVYLDPISFVHILRGKLKDMFLEHKNTHKSRRIRRGHINRILKTIKIRIMLTLVK